MEEVEQFDSISIEDLAEGGWQFDYARRNFILYVS